MNEQTNQFSVFTSLLKPRMMIEASAGTGKTYTIVGACIRLLVLEKIPLEKILVVTFTRMATKELKDRISRRLRASLSAVESGETGGDAFLQELADRVETTDEAAAILRESIHNFDDARVFTIHGYCQQVLSEQSLTTGMPFGFEVSQTDDLLYEAAEDYWRRLVHRHSGSDGGRYLITKVMEFGSTPGELLDTLMPAVRNRGRAEVEAPEAIEAAEEMALADRLQSVTRLRKELSGIWITDRQQILDEMAGSDVSGITQSLESRAVKMEAFLQDTSYSDDSFKQIKYFRASYFPENLKKNGSKLPRHRFFEVCERYCQLAAEVPIVKSRFLKTAAEAIYKLREQKSLDSSIVTYNDLLERLQRALQAPGSGDALARRLREQYPYALVDEFQDTDPLQYRIFEKIYPTSVADTTLMMIGDPKQAIYGFRGADLYTYLNARGEVSGDSRYSLKMNYRSTPALVEAVNLLFSPQHGTPFLEERIPFHRVEAARKRSAADYLAGGIPPVPLKIFHQEGDGTKGGVKSDIFNETARQVAGLIRQGREGSVQLKDENSDDGSHRYLTGGDIAILIHSHRDAEAIKRLLKERGVGAVTYSRDKVFESGEADRIRQLFTAVLDPGNLHEVQTALASGFFGLRLSALYELQSSDQALAALTERLQKLQDHWNRSGCLAMMRKLLFEQGGLDHLSRLNDCERVITNLQQLIELAAFTEQEQGLDPPALLRWFKKRMAEAPDDDEETLRLESDENLVKIITIHNSKGLQFPVVFCPTLWEGRDYSRRAKIIETAHRTEPPFEPVVNLEQYESERRIQLVRRAHLEEVCEEVRKAYVALTRARYDCRVFWGGSRSSHLSGLGALLLGKEQVEDAIRNRKFISGKHDLNEADFTGPLKQLSTRHPGLISFGVPEGEPAGRPALPPQHEGTAMSVRPYNGPGTLQPHRALHSFSSLVHHAPEAIAEPDYDQYLEDYVEYATERRLEEKKVDIFHFPRGKTAGTFIHKLFEDERLDFRDPGGNREMIGEFAEAYGYDGKWVPVLARLMENVAEAGYKELELNKVKPSEMLKELEFYFPVAQPRPDAIREVIRGAGPGSPEVKTVRGYMTGFIDLVVRQNDRYYILDYKSNHLGNTPEDYNQQALQKEISEAGYDIQYHLYATALKKYLEGRDPGFSYSSGFGGVYYLFVRGMQKGSATGIYFDKPGLQTIEKLESVLERGNRSGS